MGRGVPTMIDATLMKLYEIIIDHDLPVEVRRVAEQVYCAQPVVDTDAILMVTTH
jgi:uncharacterized protein (UPF0147 family)